MRIAIYARKSIEKEDRQVQSLEDQLGALRLLAKREGYRVAKEIDESRSAKEPGNRPKFEELLTDIEANMLDGVLTWSMSRLSRNPVDGGRIAYLLQKGKLEFIQTIERRYLPDDNALMLSIENGMATAYLQDLSRNVKRGMQGKIDRGWHSSKAPVGYRNDPETREIVPDPERYALVRRAWDLMISGSFSVSEIHQEMQNLGLTVRSKRRKGILISRAKMHLLFRDPFYAGIIRYLGKTYPGKHRPMVTREEFESVQRTLQTIRARADRRPRRHKRLFAFSGVLRCAVCGCSVIAEQRTKRFPTSGRVAVYTYYHCSGSKGCPKVSLSHDDLQTVFEQICERIRIPSPTVEWVKEALLQSLEGTTTTTAKALADIARSVSTQKLRLKRLTEMRLDGELQREEYLDLKGTIEEAMEASEDTRWELQHRDQRVLQLVYEKLDLCVQAEELSGNDCDPFALGRIMTGVGTCLLNLKKIEIRIDPILQKIAAFEPLRNGSERPKRGDCLPSNSIWWALVEDIRIGASTHADMLAGLGEEGDKGLVLSRFELAN